MGRGSVLQGTRWVLTYHLGSIAFGSFLIALVEIIRVVFEYYAKKLEKGGTNKVTEILLKVTRYCLDCFERFVRFLTQNAYIMIAVAGSNFCMSAKRSFGLIFTNAMRFGAVAFMAKAFYILGILVISSANGMVVYLAIKNIDPWKEDTVGWAGPVTVGFLQGLIAAVMYMGMFKFSTDTILMCFLVDEDDKRPGDARPAVMNEFV